MPKWNPADAPSLDWEDEDIPDGVDPKTAPVLITKRTKPKPAKAA